MGQKTFKPTKSHEKGSKRDEMHLKAQATLGSGDMAMAVKLPKGEVGFATQNAPSGS